MPTRILPAGSDPEQFALTQDGSHAVISNEDRGTASIVDLTTGALSGIGQDQFLQLLIAQLKNQDPLSPVDNSQFISQLASLNTVQGIQSLNASFAEMLKLQQLTQGVELIGKTVTYRPTGGTADVSGKVDSISVQNNQILLKVGTASVGLDQVTAFKA